MYVISFANPKGGTGKSTTALIVAEQLASAGLKVGVIDNDPSQNLLHWATLRTEDNRLENITIEPKSDPR